MSGGLISIVSGIAVFMVGLLMEKLRLCPIFKMKSENVSFAVKSLNMRIDSEERSAIL